MDTTDIFGSGLHDAIESFATDLLNKVLTWITDLFGGLLGNA